MRQRTEASTPENPRAQRNPAADYLRGPPHVVGIGVGAVPPEPTAFRTGRRGAPTATAGFAVADGMGADALALAVAAALGVPIPVTIGAVDGIGGSDAPAGPDVVAESRPDTAVAVSFDSALSQGRTTPSVTPAATSAAPPSPNHRRVGLARSSPRRVRDDGGPA